MSVTEH